MSATRASGLLLAIAALSASPAAAQQSASYQVSGHSFGAGGSAAMPLTSPSYGVSLGSLGGSGAASTMTSPSYSAAGGFAASYPPAQEVHGLRFAGATLLTWLPEPSGGIYNLYRDLISAVTGGGYGLCDQQNLADEQATDADLPPSGDGYFYLVTAENLLGQEGIKGRDSGGFVRPNPSPCP